MFQIYAKHLIEKKFRTKANRIDVLLLREICGLSVEQGG